MKMKLEIKSFMLFIILSLLLSLCNFSISQENANSKKKEMSSTERSKTNTEESQNGHDKDKKKQTYVDIFKQTREQQNILYVKNKFITADIEDTPQNRWQKFQYLSTFLSKVPEYSLFKEMIEDREAQKKEYIGKLVNPLFKNDTNGLYATTEASINKLSSLLKTHKVVMLNEMHWHPKHRLMAQKLLKSLKEHDFTYIAVEAVSMKEIDNLNQEMTPTQSTGFYTQEPYFAHFIRQALKDGFKVVGYDQFDTDNREEAQAINLNQLLKEDPTARMFVYAGIDHILENNSKVKKMAAHFKEVSGIDPLTIDQVEVAADLKEDIVLLESGLLADDEKINTNVDYFLINNIEPGLVHIYSEDQLMRVKNTFDSLNDYIGQEVFLSVYREDEFAKYKRQSIPILNRIITIENIELELNLPPGDYLLKLWSKNDELVLSKKIANDS